MKRHWRDAIKSSQTKLQTLVDNRTRQLENRKNKGLQTVSIVGYTNAGKSSLYNAISKKQKLVEDALFATLDSSVGQLYLPDLNKAVIVSDTIGFIQNLPPSLIDAFKSTLLESIHADVLLHVIDISDPKMELKIQIVEEILTELGVENTPKIYVFNKIDLPNSNSQEEIKQKYNNYTPVFISAENKTNLDELKSKIAKQLSI